MKKAPVYWLVIVLFFTTNSIDVKSQPADSCKLTIGTCLGQLNGWSREVPFVDLMKTCLSWQTQVSPNVADSIPADSDGYPLQIPYTVNGQQQTVYTRMIYGQKPSVLYPAGTYIVLYEGSGTLQFLGDAVIASQTPGRIVLNVTPSTQGIHMVIAVSNAADHIRNIRVLMPGTEATYLTQPFTQAFLNYLSPFKVIRPMWWQFAWQSDESQWSDRRTTTYYRQSSYFADAALGKAHGCAYEYIIRLCNFMHKDLWLCVPHAADSNYVVQLARLMRDSLDPTLKIYLEYSNELWNGFNTKAVPWVQNNAPQSLNTAQRIAYFYKKTFDIWQGVFGPQMSARVIRVAGCQLTNPWFGQQEMAYLTANGSGADALAPDSYFLSYLLATHDYDTLAAWGSSATAQRVIELADRHTQGLHSMCLQNNQTAISYGLKYIFYEGGQNLTPQNYAVQPYNPAIYAAQTDPLMYNIYMRELSFLRDSTIAELFMHFVMMSDKGEFLPGMPPWGAMESVFQDTAITPSVKFRALVNNIHNCSGNVLAIRDLRLEAFKEVNGIRLAWLATGESDVRNYIVEHSASGRDFTGRQTITSLGDGNHTYSWTDTDPLAGANYYRVKCISRDGRITYSAVVLINWTGAGTASFRIFPNPVAGNNFTLAINSLEAGQYHLYIFNTAGQVLYSDIIIHNGNASSAVINLPPVISGGTYCVMMMRGSATCRQLIFIQPH